MPHAQLGVPHVHVSPLMPHQLLIHSVASNGQSLGWMSVPQREGGWEARVQIDAPGDEVALLTEPEAVELLTATGWAPGE